MEFNFINKFNFSIVIPFKFGAKYASACFSSIEKAFLKTTTEVVLVLDDPSSIELKVLKSSIECHKGDIPLKVFSSSGTGISDALNSGIRFASGDYIVRHDIDDLCFSWRGLRLFEKIKTRPDFIFGSVVCFPVPIYLKVPDSKIHAINIASVQNPFFHPASAYKKDAITDLGGYDKNFDRLEDYELWCRVLESSKVLIFDEIPHTKYRKHSMQFTRQRRGIVVDGIRSDLRSRVSKLGNDHGSVMPEKSFTKGLHFFVKDIIQNIGR